MVIYVYKILVLVLKGKRPGTVTLMTISRPLKNQEISTRRSKDSKCRTGGIMVVKLNIRKRNERPERRPKNMDPSRDRRTLKTSLKRVDRKRRKKRTIGFQVSRSTTKKNWKDEVRGWKYPIDGTWTTSWVCRVRHRESEEDGTEGRKPCDEDSWRTLDTFRNDLPSWD